MNDTECIDLLESLTTLIIDQYEGGVRIFTIPSQHQSAPSVREALEIVQEYAIRKRCWLAEHSTPERHARIVHDCIETP